MRAGELRTTLIELRTIWTRRQARRPDRYNIADYCDAVSKGLFAEPRPDRRMIELVNNASDDQLVNELLKLRAAFAADEHATVDCIGYTPSGRTVSGSRIAAFMMADAADEEVEFDIDD